MELNKKAVLFRYMFVISTVCGMMGIYCLYKGFAVIGWILAGFWLVLGALVRILIIRDKKNIKK
ncbi:MAG: hypothetical protein FWF00_06835 [Endomicrobia bacterium]|nr:hypothetical protein [Endomicrobiia bacterium]MCL2507380.1 hypothetical protein [Endomicrobiia bacterium]